MNKTKDAYNCTLQLSRKSNTANCLRARNAETPLQMENELRTNRPFSQDISKARNKIRAGGDIEIKSFLITPYAITEGYKQKPHKPKYSPYGK